jgi:group I intron endonuclease
MGYIYKITNTVTGKHYIGETIQDYNTRWRKHINSINYKEGCPLLKASMKKHGVDKFTFTILIICFDEDLVKYEKEYIKKYNSQTPNGYNILSGGQIGDGHVGYKHSPETIEKIKEAGRKFREKNPNHYETYRERHQATMKTIDISSCVKNSEKFKKRVAEEKINGRLHKRGKLSDETKEKIRKSVTAYFAKNGTKNGTNNRKNNANNIEKHREIMTKCKGRKIDQYSKDNIFIKQHNSIAGAARELNIHKNSIDQNLYGKTKAAGGFIWKYAEQTQPKEIIPS